MLGHIEPADPGVRLPLEQQTLYLTCLWHQPLHACQTLLVDKPQDLATRGKHYRDPYVSCSNVRMDELEVA